MAKPLFGLGCSEVATNLIGDYDKPMTGVETDVEKLTYESHHKYLIFSALHVGEDGTVLVSSRPTEFMKAPVVLPSAALMMGCLGEVTEEEEEEEEDEDDGKVDKSPSPQNKRKVKLKKKSRQKTKRV